MSALAALLAAGLSQPAPLTTAAILAHAGEWDGRSVEVIGWPYGCTEAHDDRCFLGSAPRWHRGRGRLRLLADAQLRNDLHRSAGRRAMVHGVVRAARCPADSICLDGEDVVQVDAVEIAGRPSA